MKNNLLKQNRKGMMFGYVFALIAVLAALGVFYSTAYGPNNQVVNAYKVGKMLEGQASSIKNAMLLCKVRYPGGTTGGTFDSSLPATVADISDAICPGAPASTDLIFGELTSVYGLPPISGFSDWSLTNDGTGVFASISITSNNAIGNKAISLYTATLPANEYAFASDTLKIFIKK